MADVSRDDLRAAVAAGHLSAAQAASVLALAQARAGVRLPEDEPFELFRGFAEIFVAVGLAILFAGGFGLAALLGPPVPLLLICAAAWGLARYYTLRRRMILPSIVLVLVYAAALGGTAVWLALRVLGTGAPALGIAALTAAGLLLWFRAFRLPFTMFLIGLTGLWGTLATANALGGSAEIDGLSGMFDLLSGSGVALGTLLFGLVALVAALWFDMRDPHRLGRMSASGFWLHLLAAPALVNTVALTFWNMGPGLGYALLALALALIAGFALLIDRRSFLTAGIGYLIFLVAWVSGGLSDPRSWATVFLASGLGLTLLGTFWTDLRARLLRALPDFPGKRRLPPYAE